MSVQEPQACVRRLNLCLLHLLPSRCKIRVSGLSVPNLGSRAGCISGMRNVVFFWSFIKLHSPAVLSFCSLVCLLTSLQFKHETNWPLLYIPMWPSCQHTRNRWNLITLWPWQNTEALYWNHSSCSRAGVDTPDCTALDLWTTEEVFLLSMWHHVN